MIGGGCPASCDVTGREVVVAEGLKEPDKQCCKHSLTRFRAARRVMQDTQEGDLVGGVQSNFS